MNPRKASLFGLSLALTLAWLINVIQLDKAASRWGGLSVLLVGIIAAAVIAILFASMPWFRSGNATPIIMIGLLAGAFILSLVGGIYMTEPSEPGAAITRSGQPVQPGTQEYQEESYARSRAGGSFYYFFYSRGTSPATGTGSSFDLPECSGKSCESFAIVFLFIVAALLILGSLFVPHFWVVGTLVFVVLMWQLTARELFSVSDDGYYRAKYW